MTMEAAILAMPLQAKEHQELPAFTRSKEKQEKTSLEPSEGAWIYQQFDFNPQNCKRNPCCLSHQAVVICYAQHLPSSVSSLTYSCRFSTYFTIHCMLNVTLVLSVRGHDICSSDITFQWHVLWTIPRTSQHQESTRCQKALLCCINIQSL